MPDFQTNYFLVLTSNPFKGEPGKESLYLFNGDIVDRGPASIPCM